MRTQLVQDNRPQFHEYKFQCGIARLRPYSGYAMLAVMSLAIRQLGISIHCGLRFGGTNPTPLGQQADILSTWESNARGGHELLIYLKSSALNVVSLVQNTHPP